MTTTVKSNLHPDLLRDLEKTMSKNSSQVFREQALVNLLQQGLPTKKSEEYKYSPVEKYFKDITVESSKPAHTIEFFKTLDYPKFQSIEIFAVNGVIVGIKTNSVDYTDLVEECMDGYGIRPLKKSISENHKIVPNYLGKIAEKNIDPFVCLNNSAFEDGIFFHVSKDCVLDKPIHIVNYITSTANNLIQPHHLFVFEENSQATLIETSIIQDGAEGFIYNSLVEMHAAENSKINYYRLQTSASSTENKSEKKSIAIFNTQINQEKNSIVDTNTITINPTWLRNNHTIALNGTNCETHLNGLFITKNNQHVDNHTLVDHQQPNCQSNQLYKGILNDKSTGVFNGKIFVRKDAQKTNAYQSSKNVLLSDDATINAKPQLEIYADDVKCSHGSSTGKIDEAALFYLRARGVGEQSARTLLLQAFANDVLETLKNEELKHFVKELIEKELT